MSLEREEEELIVLAIINHILEVSKCPEEDIIISFAIQIYYK
jgi:hypothetical protein